MNRTLFDCGVRKSVEMKNGFLRDITPMMKKTTGLSKSADVKCNCCGKTFKRQQYLEGHMKFKIRRPRMIHERVQKREVCWLI